MIPSGTDAHPAGGASLIALLAGIWLFFSPWVYGASGNASAWNSWIVGVAIFLFALNRIRRPAATGLSWLNTALGIWIFVSPWVYGYTFNTGRVINSMIVAIIVFCAGLVGANSERMSHDPNAGL